MNGYIYVNYYISIKIQYFHICQLLYSDFVWKKFMGILTSKGFPSNE